MQWLVERQQQVVEVAYIEEKYIIIIFARFHQYWNYKNGVTRRESLNFASLW